MRRMLRTCTLVVLSTLARADGPADLSAGLQRLQDPGPIEARVDYSNRQEVTGFLKMARWQSSLQLRVNQGFGRLRVDWMPSEGQQILVPTSDPVALQDTAPGNLSLLLNQAPYLAQFLASARLIGETPALIEGKPTRLLSYSFTPTPRSSDRGLITRAEATFRLWIAEDGTPIGSETSVDYRGQRTRMYGRFHYTSQVKDAYGVVSSRLVVLSRTAVESISEGVDRTRLSRSLALKIAG
jgi:hypothetical protein